MPKKAIASFGFDRPEMMEASFKSIKKNPEYTEFDWFCYIDGQGKVQRSFYQEDYPDIRFVIRDQRIGLNANILLGLRDLFEFYEYSYVVYIEDDVLVSDDFIRYLEYCHNNFRDEKTFTITGFSRKGDAEEYSDNHVCWFKWYHPWGVLIDRDDYELMKSHIEPFISNPLFYMHELGKQIKDIDEDYYRREYLESSTVQEYNNNPKIRKILNITQDCMLNAIRTINNKYQIMPVWSRAQNMGFYGTHQPGDYNGEDCSNPETHKRSMHATHIFRPHYEWDELTLLDEVQV
jgi:hypothetical protein